MENTCWWFLWGNRKHPVIYGPTTFIYWFRLHALIDGYCGVISISDYYGPMMLYPSIPHMILIPLCGGNPFVYRFAITDFGYVIFDEFDCILVCFGTLVVNGVLDFYLILLKSWRRYVLYHVYTLGQSLLGGGSLQLMIRSRVVYMKIGTSLIWSY